MPKFHINPKTGNPGACKAMVSCPYGDLDSDHYGSAEEARAAYEEKTGLTVVAAHRKGAVETQPYPAFLTPEVVNTIPMAADGTTFEDNWRGAFELLGHPPYKTIDGEVRALMGNPNFGRERGELTLQRVDMDEFDPYDHNPDHIYNERGLYPHDAPEGAAGELVATIYTRNGGGNRECWCEDEDHSDGDLCTGAIVDKLEARQDFVRSWDDDGDSTYATFMFRVEETPEVQQAMAQDSAARRQKTAQATYDAVQRGELSPLVVMPVNAETKDKLSELNKKFQDLARKHREAQAKLKPHSRINLAFMSQDDQDELSAVVKKDPAKWTANDEETYSRLAGVHKATLLPRLKTIRSETKKVELYDKVAEDIEKGTVSAAALELLGGKAKVLEDKRYAERKIKQASEGIEATRKLMAAQERYVAQRAKLEVEQEKLQAALHWPGQPGRMPAVFRGKSS